MSKFKFDLADIEEFDTVAEYLEGKYEDLGRKKKLTEDKPKQLLQMINTVRRAIAFMLEDIGSSNDIK